MKKKIITTILTIIMILTVSGVVAIPVPAHADWQTNLGCYFSPVACLTNKIGGNVLSGLLAELGNLVLTTSSYVLSLAGIALNASIVLTMNIKAIVEGTPAVEQIWVVIRNISSIFIIFGLLYASIIKILDVEGPNLGQMVKNIVIAGLLINFSLFFTKVLIDGSNLVSLQLYRAIAPQSKNTMISGKFDMAKLFESSYLDGGISDIFMQSLKIPSVYNNKKGLLTGTSQQTDMQIMIATLSGSVLMIFAALSFFAIAIACVIRLVILILLLGFSPVYFIGIIFPAIKGDVSDKWAKYLKQQLIFLPAYLLFMYVAMRFISSNDGNGFFASLDAGRKNPGGATGTGIVSLATVGLLLQYTIAFILINIPLMAATQLGAIGAGWAKNANKWVVGMLGQHTLGRAAKSVSGKLASSELARKNPNFAVLANKTLGKVSGGSFMGSKGGYDKRFKDYSKERSEYANKELSLSDKEIKAAKDAASIKVTAAMNTWNDENKKMDQEIAKKQGEYNSWATLDENSPKAKELKLELDKALKARSERGSVEDQDKKIRGGMESAEKDAIKKAAQEMYAKNLEEGWDFFTSKARKDAADAIRKNMSKSEGKKAAEKFQKLWEEAGKEGGEDKGGGKKEGGGDKK